MEQYDHTHISRKIPLCRVDAAPLRESICCDRPFNVEQRYMSKDQVFDLFARSYDRHKQTELTLKQFLEACRTDPHVLRKLRRTHVGGHRRSSLCRYRTRRPSRPHLHEPHDQDLRAVQRFLRPGRNNRTHRGLFPLRSSRSRRAQADSLSCSAPSAAESRHLPSA